MTVFKYNPGDVWPESTGVQVSVAISYGSKVTKNHLKACTRELSAPLYLV